MSKNKEKERKLEYKPVTKPVPKPIAKPTATTPTIAHTACTVCLTGACSTCEYWGK
jgi:hypothetical protein